MCWIDFSDRFAESLRLAGVATACALSDATASASGNLSWEVERHDLRRVFFCEKDELLWWRFVQVRYENKKHCVCLFVSLLGVYIALLPWIVFFAMRIPINQPVSIVSWNKDGVWKHCSSGMIFIHTKKKPKKSLLFKQPWFFVPILEIQPNWFYSCSIGPFWSEFWAPTILKF